MQSKGDLSARKIGQLYVGHEKGKSATLSTRLDGLQAGGRFQDGVVLRPEHVSDALQVGRIVVQNEDRAHKHRLLGNITGRLLGRRAFTFEGSSRAANA